MLSLIYVPAICVTFALMSCPWIMTPRNPDFLVTELTCKQGTSVIGPFIVESNEARRLYLTTVYNQGVEYGGAISLDQLDVLFQKMLGL